MEEISQVTTPSVWPPYKCSCPLGEIRFNLRGFSPQFVSHVIHTDFKCATDTVKDQLDWFKQHPSFPIYTAIGEFVFDDKFGTLLFVSASLSAGFISVNSARLFGFELHKPIQEIGV